MKQPQWFRDRVRHFASQVRHAPRAFAILQHAAGGELIFWIGLLLLQGLLPAAVVLLSKDFVDEFVRLTQGNAANARDFGPILRIGGIIVASLVLIDIARAVASWLRVRIGSRLQDHVNDLIHAQSVAVDVAFYDMPDYHDRLHRARDEATYRPAALLDNAGNLLQSLTTLLAMAAVLLPYGYGIAIALVVSTLPALWVVLRQALREHEWRRQSSAEDRRSNYLSWMMVGAHAAGEIRLYGLGQQFRSAYNGIRAKLRLQREALAAKQGMADSVAGLVAFSVAAGCLAWMALRVVNGAGTLGDLALFFQAFSQGQRLMRTLLSSVGQVYYNTLFLGNLFEFLDLRCSVQSPPDPIPMATRTSPQNGITVEFENVVFDYPGAPNRALDGLNLRVPAGQIAAIVGENGAGKSTILKLVCRLYDPTAGRLLIDGTDVRALSLNEHRARIAALFQEPVRYQASVMENILLQHQAGNAALALATRSAEASGASTIIQTLPGTYEAMLGRWFADGIELSSGQWQRIALARAFARDASLIVLDEPTSAMDSWAESDWLARFRDNLRGRTAIIITHRFTTAMRADVIHVMQKGRIVESGSHAELLSKGGSYALSWNAQMQAERDLG